MVIDQMEGPTPLQSARPMAFIAMAVESECIIISSLKQDDKWEDKQGHVMVL